MLPLAAGGMFDSWDQAVSGRIQVYWLDGSSAETAVQALVGPLAACEADFYAVVSVPPEGPRGRATWLVDRPGDFARAVGANGPTAVVVDAAGGLAAVMPEPTPDGVAALAAGLHAASEACVVRAQAPVLLVERAVDPALCASLIEHWQKGDKMADGVASTAGASKADADIKRRHDVAVDDKRLFTSLRDGLVRRVLPAIAKAFQTRIVQIELPRVGCYDAGNGGWFRRHRDNSTPFTAHRQFALSVNLNPANEYDGGELRFPEFGRQHYKPPAGSAVVFSCSLLHEVAPVERGRRFGLFSFLHDERRDAQYRGMLAEQKARGLSGIRMRLAAYCLPVTQFFEVAIQVI